MSDEIATQKRPYRKRRRAELEQETRLRITEAAVDLHGSIGPARTTVSAIAERAGVQRATVYRHFPNEQAMFAACSAHWAALNPRPDPTAWSEIGDAGVRLRQALDELYAWYDRVAYMLENTTRDVSLVPAMQARVEEFGLWYGGAADALLRGRPERGARRRRVAAVIGHALAFQTWRSLVREQGLSAGEAIDLLAILVESAASSSKAR